VARRVLRIPALKGGEERAFDIPLSRPMLYCLVRGPARIEPGRTECPARVHQYHKLGPDGRTPMPCKDLCEYASWFTVGGTQRTVATTTIGKSAVSTVFVGQNPSRCESPNLFETATLGHPQGDRRWGAPTWDQAERRHKEACRWLAGELTAARCPPERPARGLAPSKTAHAPGERDLTGLGLRAQGDRDSGR
jgi:hypothetical protein